MGRNQLEDSFLQEQGPSHLEPRPTTVRSADRVSGWVTKQSLTSVLWLLTFQSSTED